MQTTNPEFVARLTDLYRRGHTLDEISGMRGVHLTKDGVRGVLRRAGVHFRPKGVTPKRILTPKVYATILAKYPNVKDQDAALVEAVTAPFGKRNFLPRAELPVDLYGTPKATATPTAKRSPVTTPTKRGGSRPYRIADNAKDVIARYISGESGGSIAKRYGADPRSVYSLLERRGIKRRERGYKTPEGQASARAKMQERWQEKRAAEGHPGMVAVPDSPKMTLTERDRELVKAREAGATYSELAARFNVSSQRVSQLLRRAGLTSKPGRPKARANASAAKRAAARDANPAYTPLPLTQIGHMGPAGLAALKEIGSRLGVVQSAVTALANRFGIVVNPDGTIDRVEAGTETTAPFVEAEVGSLNGNHAEEVARDFIDSFNDGRGEWIREESADTIIGYRDDHGEYYRAPGGDLPPGWRRLTDEERLQVWAARGGTPPQNLVVRCSNHDTVMLDAFEAGI